MWAFMFLYILVVFSGLFNKPRMCAGIFFFLKRRRGDLNLGGWSHAPTTLNSRNCDPDTSSDVSSPTENERSIGMTTQCLAENICTDQGFSSDGSESSNQESSPIFQYVEHDAPYGRQPLADMISVFSSKFPDLKTYKSCDLLPSSWISVAWYPIYRIPTGPTLQDLDACFLTFHSLSTAPDGMLTGHLETDNFHDNKIADVPGKITLPLIGLASYKFHGSMWMSNQRHEQQLTTSLLKAADDWLCQRQVDHPDYRFFLSH